MKYKDLTFEQKRARALYQKKYREEHPDYVARCRKLEKPKLERYRRASEKKKKERIIREYIREGMIRGNGWKIEITHVYEDKIQVNRKLITEENMFNSQNRILKFTFEQMLEELGIRV